MVWLSIGVFVALLYVWLGGRWGNAPRGFAMMAAPVALVVCLVLTVLDWGIAWAMRERSVPRSPPKRCARRSMPQSW